jgi:hypothetical protein
VEQRGFLTPIAGSRVSLYTDDLVLFVVPGVRDLEMIKAVLDKSVATPINCTEVDVGRVQEILACRVECFPCRYLSVSKLKRSEEQPLVGKVAARIPGWKGRLLNAAGRTALVAATMSAIPIHTSIALCLSPWAIEAIDKLRCGFI